MRGRKPTPTKLKILRNNPGRRPLNDREPMPPAEKPECPDHLYDEARAEWDRTSDELFRLGLLTKIDRAALAGYCLAWGRWVKAEGMIRKFGEVLVSPESKNMYRSPYLDVANRAMKQMKEFLTEFGMTPSSRGRVSSSASQNEDPLLEMLKRRAGRN